jgi:uncharacterized protein (TIGR02145 family)
MRGLRYILFTILLASAWSCEDNRGVIDIEPVATFRIAPASGNTTTIFRFNADTVVGQGTRDNPVLVRWDWESDGIWDRMYSTGGEITHRFFKAGDYRISMEASTLTGRCDSMMIELSIPQGYSAPRAAFTMTPDSANIKTEFTLNAGLSKDDEDSLDQLQFRWDLDGDQVWDTEFSSSAIIKHTYSDDSRYPVRLEVKDPQQMTSVKTDTLVVTRYNDKIIALVTHECWPCTLEDTVRFDASASYYIDKPGATLLYSWDIDNDNLWEETLSRSPYFSRYIGLEGERPIRVRVTDEEGLYMDVIDTIELFAWNSAPTTKLVVANRIGNTGTNYYLHLKGSSDRDDSYMDLLAQWDTDNDGKWEEELEGLMEVNIRFPAKGRYPVTAMLTDPKGKSTPATDTVWVVDGTHETGLLEDRRNTFPPIYYGTVKIGNRWWMQSNLKHNPNSKEDLWKADYYKNNYTYGERYGALYPHMATNSQKPAPCPKGWHVPTLEEWQQLMADLGDDATVERLMEGGKSEFHVVLSGQKDLDTNFPNQVDKFSGLGLVTNFWTSSTTPTGQAYAWYVDPIRKQSKAVVVGRHY